MKDNIFPFMDGIDFDSYEQFVKDVNDARDSLQNVDKELLKTPSVMLDCDDIKKIPTGRFDTIFKGIHLECFSYIKPQSPLYVMFSGANSEKKPIFSRWSYYRFCRGSVLCIADPMLKMYRHLTLGWYYGNTDLNLRKLISDFVKLIAEKLEVDNENIIFVGSSGGGAVTFECASYIPGSKAVAINPQIVLKEFSYAERFSQITGNDLENDLIGHRNNALYYIKNRINNQYLLIANIHSSCDMKQIDNIKNVLQINIQYGLNIYKNLVIWLYDADVSPFISPHMAHEYYCIWFFIEYLLNHMDSLDVGFNVKDLYRLVNEFWCDHWALKKQQKEKIMKWIEFASNINSTCKETAVFGGGHIALELLKDDIFDVKGNNFFHIRHIIDNDIHKKGQNFLGFTIEHPSDITDWSKLYIVIASELYEAEIREQLEEHGLIYKNDFIYGMELLEALR